MGHHEHKRDRAARLLRRKRRPAPDGWEIGAIAEAPLGPGIRAASMEEAMAAVADLHGGLDWRDAAGLVVPLFQRVRPYPAGFPEGVRHVLPPGISVTFGVDAGLAFVHVTPEVLAGWDRTIGEVAEHALRNLHRRAAAVEPSSVLAASVAGVPLHALQSGTGSASTFVLVPDELPRIFGSALELFIAPMRDLLIALPADVDRELAAWLHAEFAAPDPNCLAPVGFRVRDGRLAVEALGEPAAIA